MNSHLSSGVERRPTFGVGFGTSAFMHERADLRLEMRVGYAEAKEPYAQLFFGIQIKMNRWVSYFGEKMKSLGIDTFETVKGAGEVITKPFFPTKSEDQDGGSIQEGEKESHTEERRTKEEGHEKGDGQ